jgi:2,4-dienoyl-CoA reductase-like NADH-dependent reductase (Old Yellow Enzyme family)
MPGLFDPFTLRGVTLKNRIGVAPMCQNSAVDGFPTAWHLVHLGALAIGGSALVILEATAVEPEGRITGRDLGIWDDPRGRALAPIARFIREAGAVPGIQLGHAGRKSSYRSPWGADGMRGLEMLPQAEGGWPVLGPSPIAFDGRSAVPKEMSAAELQRIPQSFASAARRASAAGFDWLEVHAAHGYLLHSFHSPLSNKRADDYGGCFANRVRLTLETARALRAEWPQDKPLTFRISHTDWVESGWSTEDSVRLAALLREAGVDLIDVSSGGSSPTTTALARNVSAEGIAALSRMRHDEVPPAVIPLGPGYQVPGAEAIRSGARIPVAAVGLITDPHQADRIIREERADLVLLARELLRNPNWPIAAAHALGAAERTPVACQHFMAWAERGAFRFTPVEPSMGFTGTLDPR